MGIMIFMLKSHCRAFRWPNNLRARLYSYCSVSYYGISYCVVVLFTVEIVTVVLVTVVL